MKQCLFCLLLLLELFSPAYAVTERIENKYNVGIAVAIVTPAGTQFYNAGKTSKQANASNINQNTLFPIASITAVETLIK